MQFARIPLFIVRTEQKRAIFFKTVHAVDHQFVKIFANGKDTTLGPAKEGGSQIIKPNFLLRRMVPFKNSKQSCAQNS